MWEMDEFSNGMSLDRFNRLCDVYPFGTYDAVATLAAAGTVGATRTDLKIAARPGRSQLVVCLATVFLGVSTSVCCTALYYLI
jgi:hypothetical protein